jgi:hypothetical protein
MASAARETGQDHKRTLELIADAVKRERCILFLGAGVHCPPPPDSRFTYPAELRPPMGSELSRRLAAMCDVQKELGKDSVANLQRVALYYEIHQGRAELVDEVTAAVDTEKEPSPALRALAELGFPLVITTNYDQLFERALEDAGKEPDVRIYDPEQHETADFGEPTADKPVVFKIHGDVSRRESLVVTDEDYIQFILRMSDKEPYDPIPLGLKYCFKQWKTLFVGYSLLDYNLRVLFKTLRWKIDTAILPAMYSVDLRPDPLIFDVWHNQRRYVKFIAENVWEFVPDLYAAVRGEEMRTYDR